MSFRDRSTSPIPDVLDFPAVCALKVGDSAPAFALAAADQEMISSAELLRQGPLVVTFYRGVWCPYCQHDLKTMATAAAAIRSCGASLVAIAHQTVPDSNRKFQADNNLDFPILDDATGDCAAAFGIGWKSECLQPFREQFSATRTGFNVEVSPILPMQARYVIGPDNIVAYAEINMDYRQQSEPSAILPVLQRLASAR